MYQPGKENHQDATDKIKPQKRGKIQPENHQHKCFSQQSGIENLGTFDAFKIKRGDKNAQYGSIKQRAQFVHRFDQTSQLISEHGNQNRIDSPEDSHPAGSTKIVVITLLFC